jgi:hypothetical protein
MPVNVPQVSIQKLGAPDNLNDAIRSNEERRLTL